MIDRCGRIVKESTYEALAVATVQHEQRRAPHGFQLDKMDAMLAKYGADVSFDYHTREAFYVVSSETARDVTELVKEFQLETADDYFARARSRRTESLSRFREEVKRSS